MKLKGKVAIVTGAGDPNGLGAAIAHGFVKEGAKVVIGDVVDGQEVVDSLEKAGGEALFVKTDITDQEACFDLANAAAERFGTINCLVNNAAMYGNLIMKTMGDYTTEEFRKLFDVNIIGTFHCIQAAYPYLKENAGSIVNIASDIVDLAVPGIPHYAASKGGVIALTRCLARELGMFNVRVNALSPGFSMSGASKNVMANAAFNIAGIAEQITQMRCLQREQGTNEIVGTVLFLSSDYAEFVTGQLVKVNGGASFTS